MTQHKFKSLSEVIMGLWIRNRTIPAVEPWRISGLPFPDGLTRFGAGRGAPVIYYLGGDRVGTIESLLQWATENLPAPHFALRPGMVADAEAPHGVRPMADDRKMPFRTAVKLGRLNDGFQRDMGRVAHVTNTVYGKALCGAAPGSRRSVGWSTDTRDTSQDPPLITCTSCAAKAWRLGLLVLPPDF